MTNIESTLAEYGITPDHRGLVTYTKAVTIGVDEGRVLFCDVDGYPIASVGSADLATVLERVTDEDGLQWLHKWGRAAGYDVVAL